MESKELQTTGTQTLTTRMDFSATDIETIKEQICQGATDSQLNLFLYECRQRGLNPLTRQIYAVFRDKKEKVNGDWKVVGRSMTVQTSIDGFRLVAERTGKYEGIMGPVWCGKDGVWKDVWLSSEFPSAAKVGVLKRGFREPVWSVARWDSYAQKDFSGKPTSMWTKMPDVMIAKCAEALALRRAFPEDLSGLYTDDEMAQATRLEETSEPSREKLPAMEVNEPKLVESTFEHIEPVKVDPIAKRAALNKKLMEAYQPFLTRFPHVKLGELLPDRYGVSETRLMTIEQLDSLVDLMSQSIESGLLPPSQPKGPKIIEKSKDKLTVQTKEKDLSKEFTFDDAP